MMKLSEKHEWDLGYIGVLEDVQDLENKVAQLEEELEEYKEGIEVERGWKQEAYDRNAALKREVTQAVVEIVQKDEWETPMKRLCKIAGIDYPAITTKTIPVSIAALLADTKEQE